MSLTGISKNNSAIDNIIPYGPTILFYVMYVCGAYFLLLLRSLCGIQNLCYVSLRCHYTQSAPPIPFTTTLANTFFFFSLSPLSAFASGVGCKRFLLFSSPRNASGKCDEGQQKRCLLVCVYYYINGEGIARFFKCWNCDAIPKMYVSHYVRR